MINPELTAAVEKFANLMVGVPDSKLDSVWHWKGHDEGVRFAFFVTHLELRQLAAKLATERSAGIRLPRLTTSQRILAHYHSAFMDLQAVVLGIASKDSTRAPSKKDWPIRTIYSHILGVDLGFAAVIQYALETHRAGKWMPNPIPDKEYPRLLGLKEKAYDELMASSLTKLAVYHRNLHPRILRKFADISNEELTRPAAYWEETRFHIGYRLHRFEAHICQHTIQIEKTLDAIGRGPNEAKRLIRMVYSALAEVNGYLIMPDERKNQDSIELARTIEHRVKELSKLLK